MKIVVALGGNALQEGKDLSPTTQLFKCKQTAKNIINLIKSGHDVAIVHGNGPQVGQIIACSEAAHKMDAKHILYPLDVGNAFTQGYIGYHLQNALNEILEHSNISKKAVTLVTQVEVNKDDLAFQNPTKPIGGFFTESEARGLIKTEKFHMIEDAGRGWRRVVPSPEPINILEKEIVELIFHSGNIVITCGGGGIPVIKDGGSYIGVEAVIDKDYAAAKLAEELDADLLMILTAVNKVYINFNTPKQQPLNQISLTNLAKYIEEEHFAKGSMLPKILASKKFIETGKNKKAIIASLDDDINEMVVGNAGTTITD